MRIVYRLWLLIAGVVGVLLLVIWMFLIWLLPSRYQDRLAMDVDGHADVIMQLWENAGDDSATELTSYAYANDLHMEIRNRDHHTIFTAGWTQEADILTYPDVENVFDGRYLTRKYNRPGMGETLAVARPVYLSDQDTTLLLVCAPIAPAEDLQALMVSQMLVISAISLAFAMGVGGAASRMFVQPIQRIQQKAQEMALGDFSSPIGPVQKSELGDLARTIDDMAEQIAQMETMRQSFIATVSHQYKTPLSIIQGHTELIQDSLAPEIAQELESSFSIIADEIKSLDRMSRDILKLSELQSGMRPPSLRPLPLKPFCQDVMQKLLILAPELHFRLEVPASLSVLADPPELEHVLRNVLQNAILHAEAHEVSITAVLEGSQVRVTLGDNGKGLTEEQQKQVFTRFYKGDSKNRSGSGLGMAIVKAVLEAHGCEYGLISAPGEGTTLWFVLERA